MDDVMGGYTIEDNTFIDVDVAVVIGGGLHHRVINNTFESCGSGRLKESACIHYDNRGMNWAHELCGCYCMCASLAPASLPLIFSCTPEKSLCGTGSARVPAGAKTAGRLVRDSAGI